MKGAVTLKILEFVQDFTLTTADLFDAIMRAGYGASHSKIQYEFDRQQNKREEKKSKKEIKKRYNRLVYQLQKDGLIEKGDAGNFGLTKKGANKLKELRKKDGNKLPEFFYEKVKGDNFTIVIFDIPEKERNKRRWIRAALGNMGLTMVQKSVWLGKIKISEQFLEDMHLLKMTDFVEIFEITKGGSLRHLI
jgi:DNA-binding transcriptional regulator PaaX